MTKQTKADLALLMITIIWASSYMLTKIALVDLEPFNLTALRFIIAFSLSSVVFHKQIMKSDKKDIKHALILGFILFGMFVSMAFGLEHTTASNAGFLISLSVVLIPLISFFVLKERIERKVMFGIVLAFIGIALLSLDIEFKVNIGDLLCLLCALFCAVHVILVGVFTKESEPIALGVLQLGFAGVFSIVFSAMTETVKLPGSRLSWIAVLALSILCTALGYIVQTSAQKHTNATHTGLILSLEPVFSAILAYIFLSERLAAREYLGAFILLTGVFIAEIDFKGLRKKDERLEL